MVVKTTCGVHVADMKYCDVNTSLTIAGLADIFNGIYRRVSASPIKHRGNQKQCQVSVSVTKGPEALNHYLLWQRPRGAQRSYHAIILWFPVAIATIRCWHVRTKIDVGHISFEKADRRRSKKILWQHTFSIVEVLDVDNLFGIIFYIIFEMSPLLWMAAFLVYE